MDVAGAMIQLPLMFRPHPFTHVVEHDRLKRSTLIWT